MTMMIGGGAKPATGARKSRLMALADRLKYGVAAARTEEELASLLASVEKELREAVRDENGEEEE